MELSLSSLERKLVRLWALDICLQRVGFLACTKSSLKVFFLDILWPTTLRGEEGSLKVGGNGAGGTHRVSQRLSELCQHCQGAPDPSVKE